MIAWEMNAQTRRFTRVSGRAEAILGYPADRWRNVPGFWIGVLHPDDRERVAHAVWRTLRDRTPCEIEYRAVAADGSIVQLRDRVRVISGADGAGLVLQGAITDVTARPATDRPSTFRPPRRWRRGRYTTPIATTVPAAGPGPVPAPPQREPTAPEAPAPRPPATGVFAPDRLLSSLGEAVIASDSEHRIVYWNSAAEALLGVPAERAIGRPDAELLRTRTSAGQTAEILAGLLGRRPWSAEVEMTSESGLSIPVRITASALRDDGTILGYVAVISDLREVRHGEAVRSAAAAMDAVARLARGVALELNEGVARVEAAVRRALARVSPGDPFRAPLDDALRSVDETAALATQLLAVGRSQPLEPRPVDVREVVRRGLPAIRLLAGDDVEILTELDPGTPAAVVDPAAVSQILLNLAANSIGAMAGGGRLTIGTSAAAVSRDRVPGALREITPGTWVVLDVRDTRDVDADLELERIFEPFGESATPPGMGLAAAYGLAVRSDGHLTATKSRSGGVVFRLYVPPAGPDRT